MEKIILDNPNNNSEDIKKIISNVCKSTNNKLVVSDIELVPLYHGDYAGDGGAKSPEVAYKFLKRIDEEKVISLEYDEIMEIISDSQTIIKGLILGFDRSLSIDFSDFRPIVESKTPDNINHRDAIFEIRIFDGDIVMIF